MDFTLQTYRNICSTLTDNYYTILTVNEYLSASNNVPPKTVLLRHDVDRFPSTALRMAQIEHDKGLRTTYYFRYIKGVFDPVIIEKIQTMGHEIGYHYETVSKCRGNIEKAIILFEQELKAFRKICPINTISMHGRPLLPWDNKILWQYFSPGQFDLTGECYTSIDYQTIQYFSDTGRTWLPGKYNIRDHVLNSTKTPLLATSNELIQYLKNNKHNNICILTHPNRWSKGPMEWLLSAAADFAVNQFKKGLLLTKKYRA